jgi:hypothetical protein
MKIAAVFWLLFHAPTLMLAREPSAFATERACEAEAVKRNRSLRGSTLYYECVPMSVGEARSFRFPQVAP